MMKDARKIIASSLIAVLALSILPIVAPAYSEHSVNDQGKEKKQTETKDKAKQHVEETKDKAKQHVEETKDKAKQHVEETKDKAKEQVKEEKSKAKENASEQGQQATSNVNGTTTSGTNSAAQRPEAAEKLHEGSTFSLVGSGEASDRDGNDAAQVSTKIELSVFRATPYMVMLKVTSGSITIGDYTHTIEQGKAVIAMKAHKMSLTAQVSSDDGTKTLKLFGSAENPKSDGSDNAAMNTHTIQLEGKLAQWSIKMNAEVTKSS